MHRPLVLIDLQPRKAFRPHQRHRIAPSEFGVREYRLL